MIDKIRGKIDLKINCSVRTPLHGYNRVAQCPQPFGNLSSSASAAPLVKLHEVTTNIGKGRGGSGGLIRGTDFVPQNMS